jgi:predicted nucleotidyltransferase
MAAIIKLDECCTTIPPDILLMLRYLKNELIEIEDIVSVVLFGSYSKGTYGKNSDIDIAVFVRNKAVDKIHDVYRQAVRHAANYGYDIQILIFTQNSLDNPMGIVEEIVHYGRDITFI